MDKILHESILEFYKEEHKQLERSESKLIDIFSKKTSNKDATECFLVDFLYAFDNISSEKFFKDAIEKYYKELFAWCDTVIVKNSSIELRSNNYSVLLVKHGYNKPLEAHIYYEGPFNTFYKPKPLNKRHGYRICAATVDFFNKDLKRSDYLKMRFPSIKSSLIRNFLFIKNRKKLTFEKAMVKKEEIEKEFDVETKKYSSMHQDFLNTKSEYEEIKKSIYEILATDAHSDVKFA